MNGAFYNQESPARNGFTLIEMLLVISVIAALAVVILSAVKIGRAKASDNAVRNDIRQLRLIAEQVYDTQGASYKDWAKGGTVPEADLAEGILTLRNDIDQAVGDTDPATYVSVLRDSQRKDFCASAPLKSDPGKQYCVDATATFRIVSSPCPDQPATGSALRCPSS